MTGIERLYKLIADIDVSADPELWDILRWGTEGDWDCEKNEDKTLVSTLAAIAIQIEREQGGRVSRMRFLSVVTDMERHVSGVEGMEDSPVARWARELREALGGDGRDHAADVSVSAYDLLPQEDREAIAWVRDHGGLSHVKDIYHDLRAVVERIGVEWSESELHGLMDALDRRLMPEGVEWPRYESGEPVPIGGEFMGKDGKTYTAKQIRFNGKCFSLYDFCDRKPQFNGFYGERVKRPAPKVLDADGVEIREGDRVWSTQLDKPHEWIVINPHEYRDDSQTVLVSIGDRTGHARPENLTHRAPVLAADGEPLEVGQTVWDTDAEADTPLTVVEVSSDLVRCEYTWKDGKTYRPCYQPDQLTHERPDTWERIEEDSTLSPEVYCHRNGIDISQKDGTEIFLADTVEPMARDLVRRARALAERERGE